MTMSPLRPMRGRAPRRLRGRSPELETLEDRTLPSFVLAGPDVPAGQNPLGITSADFNGDGKLDLATANYNGDSISILRGNGDGTFTNFPSSPKTVIPQSNVGPIYLTAADFNGDGKPDLAVTDFHDVPDPDHGHVSIFLNQSDPQNPGDVTFTDAPGSPISVAQTPYGIVSADFNHDHKADLAITHTDPDPTTGRSEITILLGRGDGQFDQHPIFISADQENLEPLIIAVGDFNGDANPDLAVTDQSSNKLTILLGKGDGTFTQPPSSPLSGFFNTPFGVAVGDLNRDGNQDLVVVNNGGNPPSLVVLLGDGHGNFTPAPGSPIPLPMATLPRGAATIADVDNDGRLDVLVATNGVLLLRGHGDGTFDDPRSVASGMVAEPSEFAVKDFDNNGTEDVAVTNAAPTDTVSVLLQKTQHQWTGGAGNNLWSDPGNWTNGSPGVFGLEQLTFPDAAVSKPNSDDIPQLNYRSIDVTGTGYTVGPGPGQTLQVLDHFTIHTGSYFHAVLSSRPSLTAGGLVDLDGAYLLGDLGISNVQAGQPLPLIQSQAGILGTFQNVPDSETALATFGGRPFLIRYQNGTIPAGMAASAGVQTDAQPMGRDIVAYPTPVDTGVSMDPPPDPHFPFGQVVMDVSAQIILPGALVESGRAAPAGSTGMATGDSAPGTILLTYAPTDGRPPIQRLVPLVQGQGEDRPSDLAPGTYQVTASYTGFPQDQSIYLPSAPTTPMTITVGPNPAAGLLQFAQAAYSVNETDGSVTITVTRTGGSAGAASVVVGIAPTVLPVLSGGIALEGTDYRFPANATLSWADGESGLKSLTIPLLDDDQEESDETLGLQLLNPTGAALGAQATTAITIHEDDDHPSPPVAVDDSYAAQEGQALTMSAQGGVLRNDIQPSGTPPLTASEVSGPEHGTLTLNRDGSFTYMPVAGFVGQDSFTYQANDAFSDSNVATVTVNVQETPAPPPVAVDDSYSANAGQAQVVAASGVLANDRAASGNPLQASEVTGPQHGTLVLNSDGSFTYTASAGFTGQDSFTYKANDGLADSNVATVTITVGTASPSGGQLDGVSTSAGVVLFAVRDNHSVYEHDASGWHAVGLNFIESLNATASGSGTPVLFATTQGHDLFLFDPSRGLLNTGLRFIQALSATTDAAGNPVMFAVTDAHDLFEYGPTIGLVNTGLRFIDQISATIDSSGNPIVFAITQGHDLFSFGATLGLHNLQSRFLTAITAVQDKTTGQAVLYATTQGHDLFYFDGAWHDLNSRFIQQISAGTGNAGQPVVYAITQANDLARFDQQRGWFLPKPPKALAEVHGLMNDGVMGRSADGSVLEYSPTTGWLDLALPGG